MTTKQKNHPEETDTTDIEEPTTPYFPVRRLRLGYYAGRLSSQKKFKSYTYLFQEMRSTRKELDKMSQTLEALRLDLAHNQWAISQAQEQVQKSSSFTQIWHFISHIIPVSKPAELTAEAEAAQPAIESAIPELEQLIAPFKIRGNKLAVFDYIRKYHGLADTLTRAPLAVSSHFDDYDLIIEFERDHEDKRLNHLAISIATDLDSDVAMETLRTFRMQSWRLIAPTDGSRIIWDVEPKA